MAGLEEVVLAPGGGWGTRPNLIARLGPGTIRVWLRVTLSEALRRAEAEGIDRPLLGPRHGRGDRARALLQRREPLYGRSERVVDVDGRDPEDIVREIVTVLGLDREGDER